MRAHTHERNKGKMVPQMDSQLKILAKTKKPQQYFTITETLWFSFHKQPKRQRDGLKKNKRKEKKMKMKMKIIKAKEIGSKN